MSVQLSRNTSGTQIPEPSFINCTSHHMTTSVKLVKRATEKAVRLESGKSPEKPPFAITIGALPANEEKFLFRSSGKIG